MDQKASARWTDDEVQALLSIYAQDDIQQELKTAARNEKVYAKISGKLGELDIEHSAKRCREKLKKLKQDYKRIKDHNNSTKGSEQRTNKWFDRLDALLGDRDRPTFSGAAAAKEVTETDESVADEIGELQTAETNLIGVFGPSKPRTMSPAEADKRRGKRRRDSDFLDALRDMEDANRAVLQRGQEQRDQYMQLLLESQAEEREMRRQELAFLQSEAEETRSFQRDFLSVLGQLAQSLSQSNSHTAPPLD